MPALNSENSWNPTSASSNLPDLGPSVPPPPPEVRVRTLRGDLESMSKSGGSMQPQFRSVAAPTIATDAAATNNIKTMVAIVVSVALVAGIAFFAYRLFFAGGTRSSAPPPPAAAGSSSSAKPSPAASFVHASVFKKPADQILAFSLPSESTENVAELETFNQRALKVLAGANKNASLFEMNVKSESGADLPVADILRAGDLEIIDPAFFAEHFNADGSFFVYKNENGAWPGFVFTLKPGDNWLFVKDDVAKLEDSPKLANFFLATPGVPVSQNFKDIALNSITTESQSVRMLEFSAPGAAFFYGWLRDALIISTSEGGFVEAIGRL